MNKVVLILTSTFLTDLALVVYYHFYYFARALKAIYMKRFLQKEKCGPRTCLHISDNTGHQNIFEIFRKTVKYNGLNSFQSIETIEAKVSIKGKPVNQCTLIDWFWHGGNIALRLFKG